MTTAMRWILTVTTVLVMTTALVAQGPQGPGNRGRGFAQDPQGPGNRDCDFGPGPQGPGNRGREFGPGPQGPGNRGRSFGPGPQGPGNRGRGFGGDGHGMSDRSGGGFFNPRIGQYLDLTEAQRNQIKTIFETTRPVIQTAREQLKELHGQMKLAVESGNTTEVEMLASQQGDLIGKMAVTQSKNMLQVRNEVLTSVQIQKLAKMSEKIQQRKGQNREFRRNHSSRRFYRRYQDPQGQSRRFRRNHFSRRLHRRHLNFHKMMRGSRNLRPSEPASK